MRISSIIKPSSLFAGAVALASCNAVQPKPECKAQPDVYAAHYFPVSMTGACDGKVLTGEILHLNYYRPAPSDPNKAPSVAIEPDSVLAGLDEAKVEPRPTEWSIGRYLASEPDDAQICAAPTLTELNVTFGTTTLNYKWSNLKMIVEPLSNAVYFGADLTRKDGDCSVVYKVAAAFPEAQCGDDPKDPSMGKPSQALCAPTLDNQLSSNIDYTCDEGTLACVPAKMFPALKQ